MTRDFTPALTYSLLAILAMLALSAAFSSMWLCAGFVLVAMVVVVNLKLRLIKAEWLLSALIVLTLPVFAELGFFGRQIHRLTIVGNLYHPSHQMMALAAHRDGKRFDNRTILEAVRDEDAFPPTTRGMYVDSIRNGDPIVQVGGKSYHPFGMAPRSKTVLCNEGGEFVITRTDQYGFRNNDSLYEGPVDVLLLGDSFMFGWCVRDAETTHGVLNKLGLPTLSFALPGGGPLYNVAMLREFNVNPRYVVFAFFEGNDLQNFASSLDTPEWQAYLDPVYQQGLVDLDQSDVRSQIRSHVVHVGFKKINHVLREAESPLKNEFGRIATFGHLVDFLLDKPLARSLELNVDRDQGTKFPEQFSEVLDLFVQQCERIGARPIFLYLPSWQRFHNPGRAEPHRNAVLQAAESLPLIDIYKEFTRVAIAEEVSPKIFFPFSLPGHYTPKGYEIVARAIYREVSKDLAFQ